MLVYRSLRSHHDQQETRSAISLSRFRTRDPDCPPSPLFFLKCIICRSEGQPFAHTSSQISLVGCPATSSSYFASLKSWYSSILHCQGTASLLASLAVSALQYLAAFRSCGLLLNIYSDPSGPPQSPSPLSTMKGTARVTLFILFCVPCFEEPHWFRHGFSDLVRLQPQYVYHSGQFREHPWKKNVENPCSTLRSLPGFHLRMKV